MAEADVGTNSKRIVRCGESTLNTPYKAGLTYGSQGTAYINMASEYYGTIIYIEEGQNNIFLKKKNAGTWDTNWGKLVTNADLDVWVNQTFATQQKISAKHWVTLDTGVVIPSGKTYKVGVVVYTGSQFVFPLNVYVDSSNRHVMAELSNVSDTEVTVQFATIRVCYGN